MVFKKSDKNRLTPDNQYDHLSELAVEFAMSQAMISGGYGAPLASLYASRDATNILSEQPEVENEKNR